MDPGHRMGRWYCTTGRRWSTGRMATAGRRGKTGRPHGRITWSWKCRELRWVGWQEFGFRGREWGNGGGGVGGYGADESQPSPWHRQTQVYSELSPGCNGDSHMLQSARVSKEPHRETMRHNNSFPWEVSGVEPIVCTLLRLWMLPLLQRAYINLAGSKQYCGASVPSPHSKSLPIPAAAIKGPVVSVLGSPRLNLAQPEVVAMQCWHPGWFISSCIYETGQVSAPESYTSYAFSCAEVWVLVSFFHMFSHKHWYPENRGWDRVEVERCESGELWCYTHTCTQTHTQAQFTHMYT